MSENKINPRNQLGQIFSKIWRGLKGYLMDWRNLLGHAILGVLFLILAIWAPVQGWIKLVTIICLITVNILRMRLKTRKSAPCTAKEARDERV